MLTLRHFTILRAVAQTGSFTKAAESLYITQSAVSHTIRELEAYTGMVLFDRLARQVRLTAGGRLLLEEVTPILSSCDSLEKRIRDLNQKAPLHLVSSITIACYWLPQLLKRFEQQLPDVPVYVTVVSAGEALRILQEGQADLGFVEGMKPPAPFLNKRFSRCSLKIVCAPGYLTSASISTEALCAQKLLVREKGSAIRDTLDSNLLLQGFTVRPYWESVNSTALLQAAKAGLGIAVLPAQLVEQELADKTLLSVEVEQLTLENDMIAVWHQDKHMTTALSTLLSYLDA